MKDLIQNIESRFQILITLSIFFSSLIYYLGKAANQTDAQVGLVILQFGGLVGLILIDYFIFQSTKDDFSEQSLRRINNILLWTLLFFAAPILLLAVLAHLNGMPGEWMTNIAGLTLGTLIVSILFVPVVIEFLLIIFSISDTKIFKLIFKRMWRQLLIFFKYHPK